jgi:hypothetical protein
MLCFVGPEPEQGAIFSRHGAEKAGVYPAHLARLIDKQLTRFAHYPYSPSSTLVPLPLSPVAYYQLALRAVSV